MPETENLSDYALRVYGLDGVEPLLLELQDVYAMDILLLLGACWLGHRGRGLDGGDWRAVQAQHQVSQQGLVVPLRQARRFARQRPEWAPLYGELKRIELAAEMRQLAALENALELRCKTEARLPERQLLWSGEVQAELSAALVERLAHLAQLLRVPFQPVD